MRFDAVVAVKLEIPEGFNFLKFKSTEFLAKFYEITVSKI